MKKWICIILTCFLLISVPVRGYAVSPVVWGIGEEVIFPFLLALLGVQATETISSYDDLQAYNLTIKDSLVDSLAGLAGMETVQAWIMNAVSGMIETDSIVWQKLYELAISNYIVSGGNITIPASDNVFGFSLEFTNSEGVSITNRQGTLTHVFNGYETFFLNNGFYVFCSSVQTYVIDTAMNSSGSSDTSRLMSSSYTHDGKTVYYLVTNYSSSYDSSHIPSNSVNVADADGKAAWVSVYGDYIVQSENVADYSDAFSNVLNSSEKDDIIDGTSVVQLYNPDALQNGLEIMPGGDPEDDPNLKRIPFAVTADWWNFLQQFGQGVNSNQYVNAYNALNGLDGSSVGKISDAYDSLGIANIVGSAANAAEGIVNLTDNNIYPNAQTVADAVNGTIPQILDPESPDSGIDNESPNGLYKLPDLRDYFPFCIPFDLIHLLSILAADPVTPEFVIKLSDGNHEASTIASLEVLESVSQIVRNFELAGFCLGLILITRGIIRG